ncbi:MAG: hypothetical protein FJ254_05380 [Phycisphaerae bacterium]|nr:hypothetical protein [Phycisphaerae bacterium]
MKNLKLELHFAAAAALCLAGAASADVVAWENCNLVIPANIDGLYINVETQTTGTAGSAVAGWDINPYGATALTWWNAAGTGMMRFPGVVTGSAGNLADGTVVGPTGSFGSGTVTVGANPGNWVLNSVNKFGFRFVGSDGGTHYGWGTFQIGAAINGADRTITNLYYETIPLTSVTVGSGGGPPPPYDPCAASNPTLSNGANSTPYRADAANVSASCGTIYGANYFQFTAGDSGSYTFESCVAGAGVQVAVMSGCDAFATELACGAPACGGLGSSATLTLAAGTPVFVVVGGSSSPSGLTNSVSVTVTAPPLAACVSGVVAAYGDNAFDTNVGNSGTQAVQSNVGNTAQVTFNKALWFAFTPTATGPFAIKTCGSSGDTLLAIGTACPSPGARFNCIAYNDDAPSCLSGATGNLSSFIDATNNGATGTFAGFPLLEDLVAGTTYYICVGQYSATATVSVTGMLNITGPQGSPCGGDFNHDGMRDGADLGVLLASFGIDAGGDMDGDGVTDGADLGALLAVFGTTCP